MEKYQSVRRLCEVDVLRPLAIFLVVILHCFTVYWGNGVLLKDMYLVLLTSG